jgi:hypothetical protein
MALLLVVVLAGCDSGGPRSATSSPTEMPVPSATSTPPIPQDWQTYTDPKFGFKLDIPGVLSSQGISQPDANTSAASWQYNPQKVSAQPNQADIAQAQVSVLALTKPVTNCARGTAITVGQGIAATQFDNLSPNAQPGPDGYHPEMVAYFSNGGVYTFISLQGPSPRETFHQRYDTVWQHMLASFVSGPHLSDKNWCTSYAS